MTLEEGMTDSALLNHSTWFYIQVTSFAQMKERGVAMKGALFLIQPWPLSYHLSQPN
jgi:hypothetical protein